MSASARESLRQEQLAAISKRYSPLVHAIAPTFWGLCALAACAYLLRDPRAWEFLTIPIVWVMSNAAEWRIHKDLLHKRTWWIPLLYDRHTPTHHVLYVHGDMAIKDWRELKMVLIPAYAGLLLFFGLLPIAAAIWFLITPNVALIFMATCMFYVVSYELLHMSYHLPKGNWFGESRIIRALAKHHSIHHHPPLMQKWNMNVNVPLWDIVRRTRVTQDKMDELASRVAKPTQDSVPARAA